MTGEGFEGFDYDRQWRYEQAVAALQDVYRTHYKSEMVAAYDGMGRAVGIFAGTTIAYGEANRDAAWELSVRKVDPFTPEGEYQVSVTGTHPDTGLPRGYLYQYDTRRPTPPRHAEPNDDWHVRFLLDHATYAKYAADREATRMSDSVPLNPMRVIGNGYYDALQEAGRAMQSRYVERAAQAEQAYEADLAATNPFFYFVRAGLKWLRQRKTR